jgi:hypothetical protein
MRKMYLGSVTMKQIFQVEVGLSKCQIRNSRDQFSEGRITKFRSPRSRSSTPKWLMAAMLGDAINRDEICVINELWEKTEKTAR